MAPEPLNRLVRATVVSLIGLRDVYRSEAAFRQELLVLLLVIPAA
jgi:diacylglycerol kinase